MFSALASAQGIAGSGAKYDGPAEFPRTLWCAPGQALNVTLTNGPGTCDYLTWAYGNNTGAWPQVTVCSSGCTYTTIKAALAAATSCPLIILARASQSETWSGGATHKNLTGCNDSNWVIIMNDDCSPTTGACTHLSNQGTRIFSGSSYEHTVNVDTCLNAPYSVLTAAGANHYWWGPGIKFYSSGCAGGGLEFFQVSDGVSSSPSTCHHFVFDRMALDSSTDANGQVVEGILSTCGYTAVMDSEILGIHTTGGEHQGVNFAGDTCDPGGLTPNAAGGSARGTKCTAGKPGPGLSGPFKLVNTAIETASINAFVGGQSSGPTTDVEIRKNYLYKRLSFWANCANITYLPANCYDGLGWGAQAKNLLEFKGCVRCVIEGNAFVNHWQSAQNYAIVFENQPPQDGLREAFFDVIFRFNKLTNIPQFAALQVPGYWVMAYPVGGRPNWWNQWWYDNTGHPLQFRWRGLHNHDNVVDVMGTPFSSGPDATLQYDFFPQWYWFDHNTTGNVVGENKTVDGNDPLSNSQAQLITAGWTTGTKCVLSDNILLYGLHGFNAGTAGSGSGAMLTVCAAGQWTTAGNLLVGDAVGATSWYNYASQFVPANDAAIGYTNLIASRPGSDYTIAAGGPYHAASDCNTGYNGSPSRTALGYSCDEGADISQVNSHTAGVVQLTRGDFTKPQAGSTAGGTAVVVFAYGLDSTNGAVTITVGGVACTPVVLIDVNSASCTTGAHAAGTVDVVLTQGSRSVPITGGFTYQ